MKIVRELPTAPNQVHSLMELDAEKCAMEKLNNYVTAERIKILEAKEYILEALKQNKRAWGNLQRWAQNTEQSVRSTIWENKLILAIDRDKIEWARWGDHGYERGTHELNDDGTLVPATSDEGEWEWATPPKTP
jgi:hypothetical protein